jgi:hypothetical protein
MIRAEIKGLLIMVAYANESGTVDPSVVNLSSYDTGSGVDYKAGNGNSVINADNGNDSINVGNNSDKIHLGAGSDYVTLGGGQSQIAIGTGNSTIDFEGNLGAGVTSSTGLMDNIVYFKGAGDAWTTPTSAHGAGASLELHANDGAGHQSYDIVNGAGVDVGIFSIAINKDVDGTYHTLSASTDYTFI